MWSETLGLCLLGYLVGSLNSAILVCRMMGLPSPRTVGSGNPGATNVLRMGNKKAALLTFIGDFLKGVLPVLMGFWLGFSKEALAWVALACVLGHIWPIFFGFQGGKGVATAMGGLWALSPLLGALVACTWLLVAFTFRYSSLAALIAIGLSPLFIWSLGHGAAAIPLIILVAVVFMRHQANIKRLIEGSESKIGQKKN